MIGGTQIVSLLDLVDIVNMPPTLIWEGLSVVPHHCGI